MYNKSRKRETQNCVAESLWNNHSSVTKQNGYFFIAYVVTSKG